MSDLQFEQDKEWLKYQNSYWDESQRMPILVKLVMKLGLERRQAYYVLFGILLICSFITFQVIKNTFFPSASSGTTYVEDLPEEIKNTIPKDVLEKMPSRR